jgi:hypothetical protein
VAVSIGGKKFICVIICFSDSIEECRGSWGGVAGGRGCVVADSAGVWVQ